MGGAPAVAGVSAPQGGSTGGNSSTPVATAGGATAGRAATPTGGGSGASGATPVGSGAGTGAATGAAGTGASAAMDKGEFWSSGSWQGYVWTSTQGAGSTITPMDFKAQMTGMPRCVKGSVAATTDYSGIAILGFNLAQGSGASTTGTITPTKAGIRVDVTNNGGSPLRFQVTSGSGASQQRWCATLTGSGGFIPWASLNTMCWDGTGTAYKNEPIDAAMVLVPGTMMGAVAFDFCVNGIAESDSPAGGTAGMGATAGASTGAAGMSTGAAGSGSGAAGSGGSTKYPPVTGSCQGWATRYWDCCKPHCGWSANAMGSGPLAVCDRQDNSLASNPDVANSCEGGQGYLCQSMAPWAADSKLAYGYAAVAAKGDICGKCYQLEFTGQSHNAGNDPGAAALGGKTMIVQSINIGGDVGSNQFDIAIPGGGVGAFNACSDQWGVAKSELGQQYGGFLATCKAQANASDHQALKSCVMQKCTSVFEAHNLTELAAGCKWYVDWFEAADNPSLKYAEIACPPELTNKGLKRSGGGSNSCLR